MKSIQTQILEKQREMKELEDQMLILNQERLQKLYPGRCFQYCIDRQIVTQGELANFPEAEVRAKAEKYHFNEIARKSKWPCGNDGCEGWDTTTDMCPCGKQFYWVYEERLSLTKTTLDQPAASVVNE